MLMLTTVIGRSYLVFMHLQWITKILSSSYKNCQAKLLKITFTFITSFSSLTIQKENHAELQKLKDKNVGKL